MKVLLTMSWREVREGFTRFLLTLLSVALGVMFLTGTLALRDTLQQTFDDIIGVTNAADLYVVGKELTQETVSITRATIPIAYERKIASALGTQALTEPEIVTTQASVLDQDGERISVGGAPTILKPAYDDPRWGQLTDGRWPRGPRELVMDAGLAQRIGYGVGDQFEVIINSAKRPVTLTGTIANLPSSFGSIPIFMERRIVEPIAAPDKKVKNIGVYLPAGMAVEEAMAALVKTLPADAIIMTRARYADESAQAINTGLGFVSVFLLVFVFLSIFIGSFVIANTFAMIVRQRMKQFAMMRAIGAKPATIFGLVIIQAILIGSLGSVLGLGLGFLMLEGANGLFAYLGAVLAPPVMSPQVMVIGLGSGLVVTVAGAILSARRAALTDPLEVLRESGGAQKAAVTWRTWVGLAMVIAGIGAAALGASQEEANQVGVGAVLILVGILSAQVLVTNVIMTPIAALLAKIWPVQSRIAIGNVLRNPSRTASTAGALIIGVALVITGATISASLKGASTERIRNFLASDFVVYTGDGNQVPRQEAEKIAQVDGVAQHDLIYMGVTLIEHDRQTFSNLVMFVTDRINDYRTQTLIEGDEDALADGEVIINVLAADQEAWKVGDPITITTPLGTKKTQVGALVKAPALFTPIIVPNRFAPDLLGSHANPVGIDIKIDKDADPLTVQREINDLFPESANYQASSPDEIEGQGNARIDSILAILYALLGLSVVTAVVGIVNTLVLSVMERVREIGMVRAIGMSRLGVMGMITIESVLLAVFGTILGLMVGLGLSWALIQTLASIGISEVIMPTTTLIWLVIGSVIIGIAAAVFPAYRASLINELEAMAE